jgi:hypothetical protein
MAGYGFRGRGMHYDPDAHLIEQERQRWVYEKLSGVNEAIIDLTIDPEREYQAHRDEYLRTGDRRQLELALEYVRA